MRAQQSPPNTPPKMTIFVAVPVLAIELKNKRNNPGFQAMHPLSLEIIPTLLPPTA